MAFGHESSNLSTGICYTSVMKILKFKADWCGPCKIVEPVVKKISEAHDLEVETVDVDSEGDIADDYSVQSVPTLILFDDDGHEIGRVTGAKPYAVTEKELGLV